MAGLGAIALRNKENFGRKVPKRVPCERRRLFFKLGRKSVPGGAILQSGEAYPGPVTTPLMSCLLGIKIDTEARGNHAGSAAISMPIAELLMNRKAAWAPIRVTV